MARGWRLTVFLGSRGTAGFTLRAAPRDRSYHSGNWGGALSNPATVLANALSCLVDGRGRLLVPALRPPSPPAWVREALRDIPTPTSRPSGRCCASTWMPTGSPR